MTGAVGERDMIQAFRDKRVLRDGSLLLRKRS